MSIGDGIALEEVMPRAETKETLDKWLRELRAEENEMSDRTDRAQAKVVESVEMFFEAVETSRPAIVKLGMSLALLGESLILAGSPEPKAPEAVQ